MEDQPLPIEYPTPPLYQASPPPLHSKSPKSLRLTLVLLGGIVTVSLLVILALAGLGFLWDSGSLISPKVALFELKGPIMDSDEILKDLNEFRRDDSIQACVIRIDSPGGGVVAAQDVYSELLRLREEEDKIIVVSFGNMGASGAYYIACGADKIIAGPGTLTGSIGVIMELPIAKDLFQKIGLRWEVVKSGDFKDAGSLFKEFGEEERKLLQAISDDVHDQFIQAVSEGRALDIEEVRSLANGMVYTGRQALDLGLVDELGNLRVAIDVAKELAGISGEARIIRPHKSQPFSLTDLLQSAAQSLGVIDRLECPLQYRMSLVP